MSAKRQSPAFDVVEARTSSPVFGMVIEAVLTFFLVNTVLHTAVAGRGGKFAGWAIGTTLAFAILAGGPFTGASLNPARTFGPAVFSLPIISNVYTYVIYLFGPLIGSTFALMVYNFFNSTDEALENKVPVVKKTPARKSAVRTIRSNK